MNIDTIYTAITSAAIAFIGSWIVATGSANDAAGVALTCAVCLVAWGGWRVVTAVVRQVVSVGRLSGRRWV
jgi:hypothetical protein